MNQKVHPFSCSYSKNVPSIFHELHCSLAISTYQAGKVILIGTANGENLVQLPRNFDKAMGIGVHGRQIAVATRDKVHILTNDPKLAVTYPDSPKKYDALYLPRKTYYTGLVDIHDVHITTTKLLAVNTSFSCLVELDDKYSWRPFWSPPQIDNLASEDRCHLNGLAIDNEGNPRYASALGSGNSFQSWRQNIPDGGMLYDLQKKTIVSDDLKMPHSPRIYKNRLFLLESALGQVKEFNSSSNSLETIAEIPAFTRGLAIYKDFIFVGKSRLRSTSKIFRHLEIGKRNIQAGISIIHLPSRKLVGEINYLDGVEEIYDVQIIQNATRPNILNTENELSKFAISTPKNTYWASPKKEE